MGCELPRSREPSCARAVTPPNPKSADDLAGIEDAMRVERALHRPHHLDGGRAMLRGEKARLAVTDAVLAGGGAAVGQSALDQPRVEGFGARDVLGVVRIHEDAHVEVAVPDVSHDRG